MRILLIEDDDVIVRQITDKLQSLNLHVDASGDGEEGLYLAKEYQYNMAIIDLGLPKRSGLDVIQSLRDYACQLPILILTARSSWQDKVHGLNAGADDYLVKPFQMEELVARVQALLRRSGGYGSNRLQCGPIVLDMDTQAVQLNGAEITLTAFEYRLLEHFMLNPKKVRSKTLLAEHLYGHLEDPDSNVIEVMVARLRQKIDPDGSLKPIETLRGRGYRLNIAP